MTQNYKNLFCEIDKKFKISSEDEKSSDILIFLSPFILVWFLVNPNSKKGDNYYSDALKLKEMAKFAKKSKIWL